MKFKLIKSYMLNNQMFTKSHQLFEQAKQVIPGGVNSPVRAFKSVGGFPVFMARSEGAYLYDADGNRYIDFINSWGPMILGHSHPKVVRKIQKTVEKGTSFGAPTELETQLAELAINMVPNINQIRMVNSGTEACMSAIRLARGYTGKNKFIKFAGCYHGHSDSFLIQAGSGASTFGSPNSPGVTEDTAKDTLLATFNDLDNVDSIIKEHQDEIAAIILEPVAGNMGCIPPKEGFLEGLQKRCDENGILLVFDEVMTGFRLAKGGAQELYQVQADLVCFGKIIGGGMPVGAFAGSKKIMGHLSPQGAVYQAGTLSGNPLSMSAGIATLSELIANDLIYSELSDKTERLKDRMHIIFEEEGVPVQINSIGSMISIHFCENPVVNLESAKKGNNQQFKNYFHYMLQNGVYLPPSPFETWFVSDSISNEDIDQTLELTRSFLKNKVLFSL